MKEFEEGYKANKALYTEDDLYKAWAGGNDDIPFYDLVKLLNKPKEIESVELEKEDNDFSNNDEGGTYPGIVTENYEPKLNNEGLLIINKINYK